MKHSIAICIFIGLSKVSIGVDFFAGWELSLYTHASRTQPVSFAWNGLSGSDASISQSLLLESYENIQEDGLPKRGLLAKGWPRGVLNNEKYIEFSVTPPRGKGIHPYYINLPIYRESGLEQGPTAWEIRSNIDSYSSRLGEIITFDNDEFHKDIRIDLSGLPVQHSEIIFRVYGYKANSPEGAGGLFVYNSKLYFDAGDVPKGTNYPLQLFGLKVGETFTEMTFRGKFGYRYTLETSSDLIEWESVSGIPFIFWMILTARN